MTGIYITLKDGIRARVENIRIVDTYAGQLAGTLTVGTRHQMSDIIHRMRELKAGKEKGYYYLQPELVDEAVLRGLTKNDLTYLHRRTDLGMCLKDQHLVATLHMSDSDYCHIIEIHWFQTSMELAGTPLVALMQDAVRDLSYEELYPYCEHEDWLDMF